MTFPLANRIGTVPLFILSGLGLRFFYGLWNGFIHDQDHQFIYVQGLKFYTTGEWPYFGPDIVYTQSQIPGALQALWVAIPLWVIPIPESPYLFLTLAVVGSLSFLSWYLTRLDFSLPPIIIWIWVGTMPWSIFFGSTIINPAYVMVYSTVFMVAFYEMVREKKSPLLSEKTCYFLMGFTTVSIAQLHLSWVLLLPLIAGACGMDRLRNRKPILKGIQFLCLGVFLGGLTLYPTLFRYGLDASGGSEKNLVFNVLNYKTFFKTFFNFMYFASYQVITLLNRYSFIDTWIKRESAGDDQWWVFSFTIIPHIFGFFQIALYSYGLFGLVSIKDRRWLWIRSIMFIAIVYTWLSLFFNDSGNSAHKYFLFFPLTVIYSLFVLEWLWKKRFFKWFYSLGLILMLVSHLVIAIDARFFSTNPYLFHKVRDKISSAMEAKDYTLYSKTRYDHYVEKFPPGEKHRPGY